ncbi:alpha/beta fold hydrolase [Brevibacterium gallinarum]|uniref:Alpha/beta hydrolase n=1 Tax=Brevibacterium gallinarum TaxID=2762220 RepID=A0ABR8WW98_9MICO|nr:alpha/beta hydrolase [Brevibacterium gallinarum]MBD8020996.1 alpha/beta hydrolase [Brevibacterium gallinarum]
MTTTAGTPDRNRPGPEAGYVSTFGDGSPVTLFGHGFSGAIRDTRPFATGVEGTRALVNLGGHGGRPSPGRPWTYQTIADQLADALERTQATRALGVSMSAGGLARLITSRHPAATGLEKVAFVLPASFDGFPDHIAARNTEHLALMRGLLNAGDREGLYDALLAAEPDDLTVHRPVQDWVRQKVDALFDTDMSDGVGLAGEFAVDCPAAAAEFTGDVLVLTHEDDPAHPVEMAQRYAEAFPAAELIVLPAGSILWKGRSEVRRILTGFFNDQGTSAA